MLRSDSKRLVANQTKAMKSPLPGQILSHQRGDERVRRWRPREQGSWQRKEKGESQASHGIYQRKNALTRMVPLKAV